MYVEITTRITLFIKFHVQTQRPMTTKTIETIYLQKKNLFKGVKYLDVFFTCFHVSAGTTAYKVFSRLGRKI